MIAAAYSLASAAEPAHEPAGAEGDAGDVHGGEPQRGGGERGQQQMAAAPEVRMCRDELHVWYPRCSAAAPSPRFGGSSVTPAW